MSSVALGGGEIFGNEAIGRAATQLGKKAATKLASRAALGLLGPLGAAIGVAMLAYDAYELYQMYNESHSETSDEDPGECTGECAKTKEGAAEPAEYPANPDDLLADGWKETTHPDAQGRGHRTFENPKTGEKIRFDEGKPGEPGWEGSDHYHRYNPNKTGKVDEYLDRNGNPVRRGSGPSHIPAGKWNGT